MNRYVADTHALFWYLTNSSKLGPNAMRAFEEGAQGSSIIYVPSIVLAEFYLVNSKFNRPLDFGQVIQQLDSGTQYVLLSFAPYDTIDFDTDSAVPEMHDRIIAGAARRLGAGLITRDRTIIRHAGVPIIW